MAVDVERWQRRWDLQQESYMPDREARFTALLDVLEVARGRTPKVLDLAGGTGSITRRVLARLPEAASVVVDLDPALLALASATFDGDQRVRVLSADLSSPTWQQCLVDAPPFDAVLTATALHWLEPERVRALYAEVHGLVAPGGIMANVDHMPDVGLAPLEEGFDAMRSERTEAYRAEHETTDWEGWWSELAAEPELAPLVEARRLVYGAQPGASHTQSEMPSHWHEGALRDAGFGFAGIAWRNLGDALVVGIR
jgi:SAM-dependent methyltransferase